MRKRTLLLLIVAMATIGVLSNSIYHTTSNGTKEAGIQKNTSELRKSNTVETEDGTVSEKIEGYPTEEQYINAWDNPKQSRVWIPENSFSISEAVNKSEIHTGTTYEVTRYPGARPTKNQLNAAWELYNKSFVAAEKNGWFRFEKGISDGYRLIENLHYINVNHTLNNRSLNPQKPENLMYFSLNNGSKILAGYMYLKHNWTSEGEQVGGPLTVWHYHPMDGLVRERFNSLAPDSANLSNKNVFAEEEKMYLGPEMIHVWFIKHPEGPFATGMGIPSENIKRPDKMSEQEFKNYTLKAHKRRFGTGDVVSSGDF